MKRILVVDDHKLIFRGLVHSLGERHTLVYVSDADSAQQAMSDNPFDLVILDVTLGSENGLDLLSQWTSMVPVFMLSMHSNPFFAVQAKNAGALGYFLKDDDLELLHSALPNPADRDFWVSEEMASAMESLPPDRSTAYETLSPREQQIFRMFAEGLGYKEIAFRLDLSAKTVNVHRSNIFRKLDINNQVDLVKMALKWGIVSI